MCIKIYAFFILLFLLGKTTISLALFPVIDMGAIANLMKQYQQLKSQYTLLQHTYSNAKQQLLSTQQLTHDAEGHYGFGDLLNGSHDLNERQWSPATWNDALAGLAGGNQARYQQLLTYYRQNHPSLATAEYAKSTSQQQANTYQQDVAVNRVATVNASYAFNNIKQHLTTIHELSEKIDQSANTKAAMDLNSRLLTEVAYIQTQELKMQVLLNQQLAQANTDAIAAKTAGAKFDMLPNK